MPVSVEGHTQITDLVNMGVPDNNTMLVHVDFEVFGKVQGE